MKLLLAMACLMASRAVAQDVTLVYQDNLSFTILKLPEIVTLPVGQQIRLHPLKAFFGQNVSGNYVIGNSILRDGDVITATGEVQLRLPTFTLSADHTVVNTVTKEIKASGNVHVTLIPPAQN